MAYMALEKVLAYIIRENGGRRELLVFDHVDFPEAGTQVPAGTLDPGESPEQGVLREAFEESGVSGLSIAGGDKGLRFRYFWIDVADAHGLLAGSQGEYLDAAI